MGSGVKSFLAPSYRRHREIGLELVLSDRTVAVASISQDMCLLFLAPAIDGNFHREGERSALEHFHARAIHFLRSRRDLCQSQRREVRRPVGWVGGAIRARTSR